MRKTYYTLHNGDRPHKIVVESSKKVEIYKRVAFDYDKEEYIYENKPFLSIKPIEIFIGKSPKNEMTESSGGFGPKFKGNSFLFRIMKNKYMFVEELIFTFVAKKQITKFVSPVGNNDVPYPYAVDEDNNYYLLVEDVIVTNMPEELKDDPYTFYYGHYKHPKWNGPVPSPDVTVKSRKLVRKLIK